ncbi:hypothetical protein C0991_002529, partial [Blastosporella zonata]
SMGSGPSNARPAKVSKTGPGQPSTKQAKVPVDILGAHVTVSVSVLDSSFRMTNLFENRTKIRWTRD